jgi:hypothetical protein
MPGGRGLTKQLAIAAAVVAVIAVPIARGATNSPAMGQVGGPPTMPLGHEDEGKKTTKPIVIGRGSTFDGHAEIVAYGWKPPPDGGRDGNKHYCIWVEYPKTDDIEFATCAEEGLPLHEIEISSEGQQIAPKSSLYTEVGGLMQSDVASVRVSFRRKGATKHAKVTLAKVTPDLQQKLNLPEGFGYWDTKVRGLVKLKSYRASGFDAQGNLLGTADHLTGQITFARPQR